MGISKDEEFFIPSIAQALNFRFFTETVKRKRAKKKRLYRRKIVYAQSELRPIYLTKSSHKT
jgi:hypothetical protein